jgi:hypothetical protein
MSIHRREDRSSRGGSRCLCKPRSFFRPLAAVCLLALTSLSCGDSNLASSDSLWIGISNADPSLLEKCTISINEKKKVLAPIPGGESSAILAKMVGETCPSRLDLILTGEYYGGITVHLERKILVVDRQKIQGLIEGEFTRDHGARWVDSITGAIKGMR